MHVLQIADRNISTAKLIYTDVGWMILVKKSLLHPKSQCVYSFVVITILLFHEIIKVPVFWEGHKNVPPWFDVTKYKITTLFLAFSDKVVILLETLSDFF